MLTRREFLAASASITASAAYSAERAAAGLARQAEHPLHPRG